VIDRHDSTGGAMLTLYFSPGACSMAAHMVLQESGEEYHSKQVRFADAEQRSEAYLKINPQCRVPTLIPDDEGQEGRDFRF
jgi:glutathione S-transferase